MLPKEDQNVPSAVGPAEAEEHVSLLMPTMLLVPLVAVAVVAVVALSLRRK